MNASQWQGSLDSSGDHFQTIYQDGLSFVLAVILSLLTILGSVLMYGIAWYEFHGNERHRNLVTIMTGLLCIYGILISNLMVGATMHRYILGPMRYWVAALMLALFKGLTVAAMICSNVIVILRFLYITYFKSIGALNEEFFTMFFTLMTVFLGCFYALTYSITEGWLCSKTFFNCMGIDSFKVTLSHCHMPKSDFLGLGTLLNHLVLFAYLFMKEKNFHPGHSKGFHDLLFRLFNCVMVTLSFIPPVIKTRMEASEFHGREYLYLMYTFSPMISMSIVWPWAYYVKHHKMRGVINKMCLEQIALLQRPSPRPFPRPQGS